MRGCKGKNNAMSRARIWVIAILALALGLRLTWVSPPLWGDETASVMVAKLPLSTLFEYYSFDPHPPLFYSTLKVLYTIGTPDQLLKILPLLYSLATIFLVYVTLLKLNKPDAAIVCSLFLTISPLHTYLGAELRDVGAAAFWATLGLYLFIKWSSSERMKSPKALWLVVAIASLHHYYGLFLFAALVAIPFISGFGKKQSLIYFKGVIWALIPWAIWMPLFVSQSLHGQSFRELPSIKRLVFFSTSSLTINGCPWRVQDLFGLFPPNINGFIPLFLISCIFFAALAFGFWKKRYWTDPSRLWFILPFMAAFAVANVIPIFTIKYNGVFLPAFFIGVALGISELSKLNKPIAKIFTFLLCVLLFAFVLDLNFNPKNRPPDWKRFIQTFESKVEPTDVILTYGEWAGADFLYHYRRTSKEPVKVIEVIGPIPPGIIPQVTDDQLKALAEKLENVDRVWFDTQHVAFADPDEKVEQLLSELYTNHKKWIINEEMRIFIHLFWR